MDCCCLPYVSEKELERMHDSDLDTQSGAREPEEAEEDE
jgi:hypothetical protein